MNALLDITVIFGLLVFLLVGTAVTAKTLTYVGSMVSSLLRGRGSLSAAAKQVDAKHVVNVNTATETFVRNSEPKTDPFRGILIHHENVRVAHAHCLPSK